MVGEIQIMTIEDDQVSTDVEQAHNGDIVDMRLIRRPENVTDNWHLLTFLPFSGQFLGSVLINFVLISTGICGMVKGGRRTNKTQMLLRSAEFVREIAKLAVDCDEPDIARRF